MSQSGSRCGYYERGPNLHLELFGHWHVCCMARWKQRDVLLQCPQLDTGECLMYCTMTKFTETWWSVYFILSSWTFPFVPRITVLQHTPSRKVRLALVKVMSKTSAVVYLLFIMTFSSKISLERLLHSSQVCALYLPSTLIADRHSYIYTLL